MSDAEFRVSVSKTIHAPAERIFGLLTHSANHPTIDGSEMVLEARPDTVVSAVGDVFAMGMIREGHEYEMCNQVVEFEPGRRLVWEPIPAVLFRGEEGSEEYESGHYFWGYELTPEGDDRTVVTETFDCSASPDWLKEATKHGEGWLEAMALSLENLEKLAAG
jgi:hypothetical protein